jgi:hypothetical protein
MNIIHAKSKQDEHNFFNILFPNGIKLIVYQ